MNFQARRSKWFSLQGPFQQEGMLYLSTYLWSQAVHTPCPVQETAEDHSTLSKLEGHQQERQSPRLQEGRTLNSGIHPFHTFGHITPYVSSMLGPSDANMESQVKIITKCGKYDTRGMNCCNSLKVASHCLGALESNIHRSTQNHLRMEIRKCNLSSSH